MFDAGSALHIIFSRLSVNETLFGASTTTRKSFTPKSQAFGHGEYQNPVNIVGLQYVSAAEAKASLADDCKKPIQIPVGIVSRQLKK